MPDFEKIFRAMNEYFAKYGMTKPIEYAFGFFDCMSVLRMIKEGRTDE